MEAVLCERRGSTFWITINRSQKRNAISIEVIEGIVDGCRQAQADPRILAIVITDAGDKAICTGAEMRPGQAFTFDYYQPTAPFADLLRLAQSCPLPTLARINGLCMAGGMGLLCITDLAIASDRAKSGLPEGKVGMFPFQVVALLNSMDPPRIVREWCLNGESFDADAALSAGLINYNVPQSTTRCAA